MTKTVAIIGGGLSGLSAAINIKNKHPNYIIKVIEKNKERPFFLYLAHWAVHNPLQALKEDVDAVSHHAKPHNLKVYSAMIRALDRSVGRILDSLEENGLTENTLIILTSDNGGASYIELSDINKPYRGWKLTHFEGGMHIPFMAKWPREIDAGTSLKQVVHHNDIFQTIAAAGKADIPEDRKYDGFDFLPFVKGEKVIFFSRDKRAVTKFFEIINDEVYGIPIDDRILSKIKLPENDKKYKYVPDPNFSTTKTLLSHNESVFAFNIKCSGLIPIFILSPS